MRLTNHNFKSNSTGKTAVRLLLVIISIFSSAAVFRSQTLDTFNPNAGGTVNEIVQMPDGKILVGGTFSSIGGQNRRNIARLNADGSFDATFPTVTDVTGSVDQFLIQPDGKILISGGFATVNGVQRLRVARLNADGSLDETFNVGFTTPIGVGRIALQPDGKILIPITTESFLPRTIVRRNSDGSADNTFTSPTFNTTITQVFLLPDGKILAVGGFTTVNDTARKAIARMNANGTLDTSFIDPNPNGTVFRLRLAPDGKIYAGGNFTIISGQPRSNLARLNSDGTIDSSFQDPAITGTGSGVFPVFLLPGGKILVGGAFDTVGGAARKNLARLNADGSLDTAFRNMAVGTNSATNLVVIARQTDGKFLLGGNFITVDGQTRNRIARITTDDPLTTTGKLFDFDGDGKSDVSVFRPSNGAWYLQQSANGFTGVSFGVSTDKIIPADYDGDGKTDISVFREGNWYRLNSSNGTFTAINFGLSTDLPVPADFDGDGKADVSVFRPSTGSWYRLNSSNGAIVSVDFGTIGDKPLIGDFDGDGKADVAVFRPSNGDWYRLNSSNGTFVAVNFGIPEDKPVPADYDGDGKSDVTVYRPSNGGWYRLNSSNGAFEAIVFGTTNDLPTAADFDGDGKADVAVFRPSNGTWYLNRSMQGFAAQTFGTNGDQPTPNTFVR